MFSKLVARTAAVGAVAALGVLGLATTPASARSDNINQWDTSRCDTVNWFCLYYSPDANGASFGYPHADANVHDLLNYRFASGGTGGGQVVGNNAASAENASWCNVGIWYHANFTGDSNWLFPWKGGNLTSYMRNNERSIAVDDATHANCKVV
ncbi:hypothetical protein [Streptomyces sp. NPDC002537]